MKHCPTCGQNLEGGVKLSGGTMRLWRAINGFDLDDADKRAEHVMRQMLGGWIPDSARATVKSYLAEHFAELMKERAK